MTNYFIAYTGTKTKMSPEDSEKNMEKFKTWMDSLGDALISPGNPLGLSKTVSSDGVSEIRENNPLLGFSLLKADSLDDAVNIIKNCPFLEYGSIEVSEILKM